MTLPRLTNPDSLRVYKEPFSYFTATAILDQDSVSSLLSWFEITAHWELVETNFYEQHELVWSEEELQTPLSFLTNQVFLDNMCKEAGDLFRMFLFRSSRTDRSQTVTRTTDPNPQ